MPTTEETTERIRAEALVLFADVGFGNTTIDDIAHASDVGVATIYRRWTDKRELANDIYARILDQMLPAFDLPDASTSKERFLLFWHNVWNWASAHPNEFLFVEANLVGAYISDENRDRKEAANQDGERLLNELGLSSDRVFVQSLLIGTTALLLRQGGEIDIDAVGERFWLAIS